MAENRIIKYEDDKKMIRWWYNRHEDEKYIEVYERAKNFINNLILHCLDENFKMVNTMVSIQTGIKSYLKRYMNFMT